VVVSEGVRGRCGEASFLFYALSSGPAGPAMLALAGRGATANLSQANIPPTSLIALLIAVWKYHLRTCIIVVLIDASLINRLITSYPRITPI
jgi:hypothetical protein